MNGVALAMAVTVGLATCASAYCSGPPPSIWAAGSTTLAAAGLSSTNEVKIYSPDHRALVEYHDLKLGLFVNGSMARDLTPLVGSVYLTEIRWSGDSSAIFINSSDGGAVGTWSTHVYVIKRSTASSVTVADIVDAGSLASNCETNWASVGWINGSRELLVIQQVPDSSGCKNMGMVVGYVVDLAARKVIERLDAGQLKANYLRFLGTATRSAVSGSR